MRKNDVALQWEYTFLDILSVVYDVSHLKNYNHDYSKPFESFLD